MKFERLGNIIKIQKGKKPSFVETINESSIRVLQIDDLRNDNNIKYTDDKTGVLADENDVLLAWDGANAGTIGYGKIGYIGSTIALLRIKEPKKYSTIFIGKFLQTQYNLLRSKSTGATIPHISRKVLEELKIPIIEISNQLKIANILSDAENLISQRKESIVLIDEFLKSTFLEMFGDPTVNKKKWIIETLSDSILIVKNGITRRGKNRKEEKDIVLRLKDIRNNYIEFNDLDRINLNENEKKLFQVEENDLLFIRVNGNPDYVGRCAIFKYFPEPVYYNDHIMRVKINLKKLNPVFLTYFLNSSFGKDEISKYRKTSAGQYTINQDGLGKIKLYVPQIELQSRFAQIVENTEALKTQYQQSLQELENLYGVLSQKAFKGELKINTNDTTTNE